MADRSSCGMVFPAVKRFVVMVARICTLFMLSVYLAIPVCADEWRTPDYVLASVRVENGGNSCSGTMVAISDDGITAIGVSAAHCFVGRVGGKFTLSRVDGIKGEATLIAHQKNPDLVLFTVPASFCLASVPITAGSIKWEDYAAVGFTSGFGVKWKDVSPASNARDGMQRWDINGGILRGGDSGGGVFAFSEVGDGHYEAALVGVISGADWKDGLVPKPVGESATYTECVERQTLAKFVAKNLPKGFSADSVFGRRKYRGQCPKDGCRPNEKPWSPDPNIPIIIPDDMPQQPAPLPIDPAPPSPPEGGEQSSAIDALKSQLDAIERRVAVLEGRQSQPGERGPKGDKGDKGDQGPPGKDADVAPLLERLNRMEAAMASLSQPREFVPVYEQEVEIAGAKHTVKLKEVKLRYTPLTGVVEVVSSGGSVVDRDVYAPGRPVRVKFVQEQ